MSTIDKFVQNLRNLVDLTPIVDITIDVKPPIPSSRGIDTLDTLNSSRQDVQTTYTLIDIIDKNVPVLHDDSKTEDPYDHVAKITGMVDSVDDTLSMILKPNGVFDS